MIQGPEYYPVSHPYICSDILDNKQLHHMVVDLATILNIRQLFMEVGDDYQEDD